MRLNCFICLVLSSVASITLIVLFCGFSYFYGQGQHRKKKKKSLQFTSLFHYKVRSKGENSSPKNKLEANDNVNMLVFGRFIVYHYLPPILKYS